MVALIPQLGDIMCTSGFCTVKFLFVPLFPHCTSWKEVTLCSSTSFGRCSIYINDLEFFCTSSLSLVLQPLMHLIICLYQDELMDIDFILGVITQHDISLVSRLALTLAPGGSFSGLPWPLTHPIIARCSLLSGTMHVFFNFIFLEINFYCILWIAGGKWFFSGENLRSTEDLPAASSALSAAATLG